MSELEKLEALMAEALTALDPAAALERARSAASGELGAKLDAVDPDGFALTAVLVARLRFERLMQGSARAREWFEADPRAFAQAFKRYHTEVSVRAAFPAEEARGFEAWEASSS